MNYEQNFLGWLIGYNYFAENSLTQYEGDKYDYFDSLEEAMQWAKKNRPAKVYRFPKWDSQFYGEKGKTPAVGDPSRDVGNATLVATVR